MVDADSGADRADVNETAVGDGAEPTLNLQSERARGARGETQQTSTIVQPFHR